MTIAELIEVLSTLPPKLQNREVVIDSGYRSPTHISRLELQGRRRGTNQYPHLRPERLNKKLFIRGGDNWQMVPNEWRLEGPWPEEAAEIGLPIGGDTP